MFTRKIALLSVILGISVAIACTDPPPPPTPAAGTVVDLGVYTGSPYCEDSLPSTCRSDADYSGVVNINNQLYLMGGGHASTYYNAPDVFDKASNSWIYPTLPTPCANMMSANVDSYHGLWTSDNKPIATHTYDLAAAVGNKIVYAANVQGRGSTTACNNLDSTPYVIATGTFKTFDTTTGIWDYSEVPAVDYHSAMETDPITGKVLVVSATSISLYDSVAKTLTQVKSMANGDMGWSAQLIHDPANDKFYWFASAVPSGVTPSVWEITLDRNNYAASTVVPITAMPAGSGIGWDLDPNNGIFYGGLKDGYLYWFDPTSISTGQIDLTAYQPCVGYPMTSHGYTFAWTGTFFVDRVVHSACYHTIEYTP